MKQTITTLLLIIPIFLLSQNVLYEELIPKYKSEILDTANINNNSSSRVLRDLTYIGAYAELFGRFSYSDTIIEGEIKEALSKGKLTNAKEYILSHTAKEKLVIINEVHHWPVHRVFTASLLEGLYAQGYRYLALEAIGSNQNQSFSNYPSNTYNLSDTTIMSRGYPLMKSCSGSYVKEPQFGNMIRKAIKLGFTIVGYEKNGDDRELNQAKNIAKIYELDTEAKMVIHVGYGHLIEASKTNSKGEEYYLMAGHLKKITGINPFTIDQTAYYYLPAISSMIYENNDDSSPQVLLVDDIPYASHVEANQKDWDLTMFHKTTVLTDGRPSWLINNIENKSFVLDQQSIIIDYPIRVKLHAKDDRLDAVPLDIVEIESPQAKTILFGMIEMGKFLVENINGDRQIIRSVKPVANF